MKQIDLYWPQQCYLPALVQRSSVIYAFRWTAGLAWIQMNHQPEYALHEEDVWAVHAKCTVALPITRGMQTAAVPPKEHGEGL